MRRTVLSVVAAMAAGATPIAAQVTLDPTSPRWGETLTITADPERVVDETQRFYKTDRLYALLTTHHQGSLRGRDPVWAPMFWDGRRFTVQMNVPQGCEVGNVYVATAERMFETTRASFLCRSADGSLPPGAVISGLAFGRLERAGWKRDVAEDLARLKDVNGAGWEYRLVWIVARREDPTRSRDERLREVQRVEQEHPQPNAAVLSSLVRGYLWADAPREALARLTELCRRYPESEYATAVGLNDAAAAFAKGPELDEDLSRLLVHVASASPENRGLRGFLSALIRAPGVPPSRIRTIVTQWTAEEPASKWPYYYLATALSSSSEHTDEAEALLSKALDLAFRPQPFGPGDRVFRERAFRLRATLREQLGDLGGALADARMAQLFASDQVGADHRAFEAELWQRLGFGRRAEAEAIDAYRKGSLKAEAFLRDAYVARTGSERGFSDDLIQRLRGESRDASLVIRPAPAFAATTLTGRKVDTATLRGKITVVSFWYIGCPFYDVELPKVNEMVKEFGDRARFIGFWREPASRLKDHFRTTPVSEEVVPDSLHIATAFGIQGAPHHVVVDREGRIVWATGFGSWDRLEQLRAVVDRLLAVE